MHISYHSQNFFFRCYLFTKRMKEFFLFFFFVGTFSPYRLILLCHVLLSVIFRKLKWIQITTLCRLQKNQNGNTYSFVYCPFESFFKLMLPLLLVQQHVNDGSDLESQFSLKKKLGERTKYTLQITYYSQIASTSKTGHNDDGKKISSEKLKMKWYVEKWFHSTTFYIFFTAPFYLLYYLLIHYRISVKA